MKGVHNFEIKIWKDVLSKKWMAGLNVLVLGNHISTRV